ncbi:MAG: hypothetical protein QXE05_00215 [Nitrososphaeria archaeon]
MKATTDLNVKKELIDILTKISIYPYYEVAEIDTGREQKLSLYVKDVSKTLIGKKIEVYFEDIITFKEISEDRGLSPKRTKVAFGPIYIHIFEKEPLNDFIAILSGNQISRKLARIFSSLAKKRVGASEAPLKELRIPFYIKHQDIINIEDFQNVKEIIVEDILDTHIEWAWMKGSLLDQSDEFKKFVESPIAGKIKVLSINYNNKDYYIYEDGRIFTRQAEANYGPKLDIEILRFFEIGERLYRVGALV